MSEDILCFLGCGQEAQHQFKNGNWCCASNIAKCPTVKLKNSNYHKSKVGWKHSEHTKRKIALGNKGRKLTEEHKAKLKKPKTKEHKKKLSESRIGIEPWNKGKTNVYSDETKRKMSEFWFKKGNQSPTEGKMRSQKTKDKISKTRQKRLKSGLIVISKETREKISKARKGKKHSAETLLKMSVLASGINSSQWKGGISCEPYCPEWRDIEYKNSIKERDGYVCQNPDCWGKDSKLVIHHINYNKKDCSPINLITVCSSCNSRANSNRELWEQKFNKFIKEK
jgi:hypothetical protein